MTISILHHYFRYFIVSIMIIIRFNEVHSQAYTGILAGGNGCGSTGDGGPATSAKVNSPRDVWGDSMGNVYFSDEIVTRVRVVNSAGIINTIVGTGSSSTLGANGPGLSTSLDATRMLVGDTGSNLYIAGNYFTWRYSFSTLQVVKIIGASATYGFGGDGGPATSANTRLFRGLAISTTGILYAADRGTCIIRAVNTTTNIITTFVGTPNTCGFSGDDGSATSAFLREPSGIYLSSNNDLYIADASNYRIRRVTNKIISTIAGTGSNSLGANGVAATSSALYYPVGVTGDSLGNIYIAERDGCRVRIVKTGIITTVLGTGTCGNAGSTYQVASSAPISTIWQVWVNTMGTLYVVEKENCIVRYATSTQPTSQPSNQSSARPSTQPTSEPSNRPSARPSTQPTSEPSNRLSARPSTQPTSEPSNRPSTRPSTQPTSQPSNRLSHTSDIQSKLPTSKLTVRQRLNVSQSLYSDNGEYSLKLQVDGNLCIYDSQNQRLWETKTNGTSAVFLLLQPDTNLVLYDKTVRIVNGNGIGGALWRSRPKGGVVASIDNDGVFRMYNQTNKIVWFSTNRKVTTVVSKEPSGQPTSQPSNRPSARPSAQPTSQPSNRPSTRPSTRPTSEPSNRPSARPSAQPTSQPSNRPSTRPSTQPTSEPSNRPSTRPSTRPTSEPSNRPSTRPSTRPTSEPSNRPSTRPSTQPTSEPSNRPSTRPSTQPTSQPSNRPSTRPSTQPTSQPSNRPSTRPSTQPTSQPSNRPSTRPSTRPTSQPSNRPSTRPSTRPTSEPSNRPSTRPSTQPTSDSCSSSKPVALSRHALFLFGSFSFYYQTTSPFGSPSLVNSSSFIVFGSRSLSSFVLTVNVSCASMSCQYPVALISSTCKRDTTSRAVVVPGDVNGDAYSDLIVCSPLTSVCNLYFGKAEAGLRNMTIGVTIYGPPSSSPTSSQLAATFFGFAVAGAEDMNEDGLADVLVSSLTGKAVYMIYGKRSWSSVVRVSEMRSGVDGYKIVADSSTTLTGISVSGVGDMNGDGRKDVALSVQRGGLFMVYVIWGGGGGGNDVLLGEVQDGVKGFSVTGEQGYYTGLSITGLGDVNDDGLDDLLIGAIPYPDRAKNPPQKSYVILGSSAGLSDIVLGGSRVGVVSIVGGGFMVSGPGDVNDDGIADIMITNVRDYVGKGNAYIISYPSRMTSSPSLIPSSFPSSSPSHSPSSEPSSSLPSPSPSSSYPSGFITPPSSVPNQTTTHKPSRSLRPTFIPTSRHPTVLPTLTTVPSLRRTTANPSVRPTLFSTVTKSYTPSLNPSRSGSPSIIPTSVASLNPSPLPYLVRVVNRTSSTRSGIVYGVDEANERFEISSMSSDGSRRSGWSGTIIGGRGRKVYVIYPKDPSQPVNRIVLEDFDKNYDVLDLSHISRITSKVDLTYLTNPLTFFLPDNQKIVLSSCQTMNDLKDENFVFQSLVTSSSEVSLKDLYLIIPLFGSMIVVLIWLSTFSVRGKLQENEETNTMGGDKNEETEEKQVDQEINREETIETKEELHDNSRSININHHLEDFDDISSWSLEDILSSIEDDEESLFALAINIVNHSTIHNKEEVEEEKEEDQYDSYLLESSDKEEG